MSKSPSRSCVSSSRQTAQLIHSRAPLASVYIPAFSVGFLEGCCQCCCVPRRGELPAPSSSHLLSKPGEGRGKAALGGPSSHSFLCHEPGPGPHGTSRSKRGALEESREGDQWRTKKIYRALWRASASVLPVA